MKGLILILTSILWLTSANAQSGQAGNLNNNFIKQAIIDNVSQIKYGNLALKKAKEGSVKSFGSQMVADFTLIDTQLHQLVITKGYTVDKSDTLNISFDKVLTKSSGPDFDNYYVDQMLTLDKNMVILFQTEVTASTDATTKIFIRETLPVLKDHVMSLTAIAKQLKIKTH